MKFNSTSLCILILICLTTYQNCAPGFVVNTNQFSSSSSGASLDTDEIARARGKALYDQNCADCHGQLNASTKAGAKVSSIKLAISSVAQMKALSLGDDELEAIQTALSPAASPDLRFVCNDLNTGGSATPAIRRMSGPEVLNTLRFVLGNSITDDARVTSLMAELPSDQVFSSVDDYSSIPQADMQVILSAIAKRSVELTDSNNTLRSQIFGVCSTVVPIEDSCAREFVKSFGLRVFRRPLIVGEVDSFVKVYADSGKGLLKGLQSALFVLLQSPEMVMHIEAGDVPVGGRMRLKSYEVANRISYMTLSTPPDALLMKAAEAGELKSLSAVKSHVERLLSVKSPDASSRAAQFMSYYGGVTAIEQPRNSVGVANGVGVTTGLDAEMLTELADYSRYMFWTKNASFEELMTSRASFPRSNAMMKILGAQARVSNNSIPVQADSAHPGYLHRPVFLASPAERTSPILRGVHIRREILCNEIPLPPTDDVDDKIAELGDIENQTNRARIGQLTASPLCIGCHAQINPLGYLFENYDQLGVPRSDEKIYDDKSALKATWNISTSIPNPKLEPDEAPSTILADSIDLTNSIAKGRTARACFAQKAFEFVRLRRYAADADGCALRVIEKRVQTGSLRDVFVESIANEDIFWRSNKN